MPCPCRAVQCCVALGAHECRVLTHRHNHHTRTNKNKNIKTVLRTGWGTKKVAATAIDSTAPNGVIAVPCQSNTYSLYGTLDVAGVLNAPCQQCPAGMHNMLNGVSYTTTDAAIDGQTYTAITIYQSFDSCGTEAGWGYEAGVGTQQCPKGAVSGAGTAGEPHKACSECEEGYTTVGEGNSACGERQAILHVGGLACKLLMHNILTNISSITLLCV